jgi:hypothetical protein
VTHHEARLRRAIARVLPGSAPTATLNTLGVDLCYVESGLTWGLAYVSTPEDRIRLMQLSRHLQRLRNHAWRLHDRQREAA